MDEGIWRVRHRDVACVFSAIVGLVLSTSDATIAGENLALPPSKTHTLPGEVPTVVLPPIDHEVLLKADETRDPWLPYRFGFEVPVDLNPWNSGRWTDLGPERAWSLRIETAGAYSINLMFSEFQIAPGGRLYVTNAAGRVLGPFTDRDNRPDGIFATRPLAGASTTLEYIEPNGDLHGVFNLRHVVHAYRDFFGYFAGTANASAPCHIDINCPAGQPYQYEKRAVMVLIAGGSGCTAELINNTQLDGKQYFLTANHCFVGLGVPAGWVFTFNYEAQTCNGNPGTMSDSVTGATVLANSTISDFCVGKIDAPIAPWYNPYFLGWDVTGNAFQSSVAVHHPALDVKKITLDNDPAAKVTAFQGSLAWQMLNLEGGAFEGSSSGSAMLDNNHRVVGQLIGGIPGCGNPVATAYFGRFDVSWGVGVSPYLDPNGITTGTLDGIDGAGHLTVDLGALSISGPPTAVVGSAISVTMNVATLGTYPPPTFSYQMRLSSDNVIDTSDPVMDSGVGSQFGPSIVSAHVPFSFAPGNYYLGLTIDPAPTETILSNNSSVGSAITLIANTLPDLAAVGVAGPSTIHQGTMASATVNVSGNSFAPTNYTGEIRLSLDSTIDGSDPLVAQIPLTSVGPSQVTIAIPANLPLGIYHLALVVAPAAGEAHIEDNVVIGNDVTITPPPQCGPITTYGSSCLGSGGFTPAYAMSGCALPGNQINMSIVFGLGGAQALVVLGTGAANLPLGLGCHLNVYPMLPSPLIVPLSGMGPGAGVFFTQFTLPVSTPPFIAYTQVFVIDPGVPMGFSSSQGVSLSVLP